MHRHPQVHVAEDEVLADMPPRGQGESFSGLQRLARLLELLLPPFRARLAQMQRLEAVRALGLWHIALEVLVGEVPVRQELAVFPERPGRDRRILEAELEERVEAPQEEIPLDVAEQAVDEDAVINRVAADVGLVR